MIMVTVDDSAVIENVHSRLKSSQRVYVILFICLADSTSGAFARYSIYSS